MPLRLRLAAIALTAALMAPGARADTLVTADDTAKILEIARGFGSAELEVEEDGSPRIRARMGGQRYMVYFYGCEGGKDCASVQFWTYISAPADPYAAANDWNSRRRFGNAYIDREGDLSVTMDVNLWGGVSVKNLDDSFDWWRVILELLDEEFPDSRPATEPADPAGTKTL
jgi:hypothetical protein